MRPSGSANTVKSMAGQNTLISVATSSENGSRLATTPLREIDLSENVAEMPIDRVHGPRLRDMSEEAGLGHAMLHKSDASTRDERDERVETARQRQRNELPHQFRKTQTRHVGGRWSPFGDSNQDSFLTSSTGGRQSESDLATSMEVILNSH